MVSIQESQVQAWISAVYAYRAALAKDPIYCYARYLGHRFRDVRIRKFTEPFGGNGIDNRVGGLLYGQRFRQTLTNSVYLNCLQLLNFLCACIGGGSVLGGVGFL